ncbi:uncharacterized protein LOC113215679 [Frankliniella occidentalis]|uniref:Uncharacterized protein LOC113215679 n=1 Tax=Frankliniella occidentalis TaxID=133901 RepID=A0A9C6WXY6_FRAOC|nr:uncharacterized protein LOC113215679 [Frankliniella occidentalis]
MIPSTFIFLTHYINLFFLTGDSHSTSHHTSITIGKNESTKQLVDYDSSASEDTENSVPSVKATFDVTPRKRNSSSLLLSTTPFKRKFSDNISESCHDSPTKRPMIKSPQKYYTPKCLCALIAKRSSSYKNAGREFFECPRGKSIGCTYFRWADTLYNIAPRCNIDSSLVNASSSLDKDNLLNDSDEVFSDPSLNLIPSLFDAPNAQAPLEDEILGDINKTEPEKIGGRPVRSRLLPKRLRKSYLIDETP